MNDLTDSACNLIERLVALRCAAARSVHHAVVKMIIQQAHRHLLESPRHRGYLGHDIRTPPILLYQPLQPPDLALDLTKPGQVVIFTRGIAAGRASVRFRDDGAWQSALGRETEAVIVHLQCQ